MVTFIFCSNGIILEYNYILDNKCNDYESFQSIFFLFVHYA